MILEKLIDIIFSYIYDNNNIIGLVYISALKIFVNWCLVSVLILVTGIQNCPYLFSQDNPHIVDIHSHNPPPSRGFYNSTVVDSFQWYICHGENVLLFGYEFIPLNTSFKTYTKNTTIIYCLENLLLPSAHLVKCMENMSLGS